MNESTSVEDEFSPEETLLSVGVLLRCSLADFDKIKKFIMEKTRAKLVYQKVTTERLKILLEVNSNGQAKL